MPTLSLTTHFTVSMDDDDAHVVAGGSTTAADTFTINYYDDKRITVADAGLVTLWNDDSTVSNFDFLWIESNVAVEIQLLCNEGGTLAGNNIENGFVIKLTAGVPFVLSNDDSRNMGNMDGTFGESQHQDEIDNWQTHWAADTIDRIECYNGTGGAAKVRCFVAT
tara:strand:- start:2476 stop:2970 length:495 start_codon:yes stop_codon:yes gene_type:complete